MSLQNNKLESITAEYDPHSATETIQHMAAGCKFQCETPSQVV